MEYQTATQLLQSYRRSQRAYKDLDTITNDEQQKKNYTTYATFYEGIRSRYGNLTEEGLRELLNHAEHIIEYHK